MQAHCFSWASFCKIDLNVTSQSAFLGNVLSNFSRVLPVSLFAHGRGGWKLFPYETSCQQMFFALIPKILYEPVELTVACIDKLLNSYPAWIEKGEMKETLCHKQIDDSSLLHGFLSFL